MALTPADRAFLLDLAYRAVHAAIHGAPIADDPEPASPALRRPCGAFVTLHRGGDLRGCLGRIEARTPLWITVRDMAAAAATEDTRFAPIRPEEDAMLTVEISVLTVPEKIRSAEEIEVGRHGLIVRQGVRSGLLLPQVAAEWGWSAVQFLQHTCAKAGLPQEAWRAPETQILRFEAEVFSQAVA